MKTSPSVPATRPRKLGVSTVPGKIALQRIPFVIKSAAIDFVRPMTAALEVEYAHRKGTPFRDEATELMLMIEPKLLC